MRRHRSRKVVSLTRGACLLPGYYYAANIAMMGWSMMAVYLSWSKKTFNHQLINLLVIGERSLWVLAGCSTRRQRHRQLYTTHRVTLCPPCVSIRSGLLLHRRGHHHVVVLPAAGPG